MGLRALVAIVLLVAGSLAYADDKPWAAGVSQENQDKALDKFKQGNESFVKDEWPQALEAYKQALVFWDHPNIRYNAAICLIKLDRMVEAYEHMTAAMRFGDAPLGKDLYKQGETYMQVLKSSVSFLEIVCKTDSVQVTIDGERIEKCPDTRTVKPGNHQIVSEKPGYRTERREIIAPPGGKETIVIVMQLEGTRKLVRRWARWKPWAVVAGGAAVGLAALPLWIVTDGKFDDYDKAIAMACRDGCEPGSDKVTALDGDLSSAKTFRTITYSTIAVGATGIAVGFVLVLLNGQRQSTTVVAPMTGADRAGVTLTTAW